MPSKGTRFGYSGRLPEVVTSVMFGRPLPTSKLHASPTAWPVVDPKRTDTPSVSSVSTVLTATLVV